MHYKNGKEAKLGDKVVTKDCCGTVSTGVVVALYPGSDICNVGLIPIGQQFSANAKDSLLLDDAFAAAEPAPVPIVEAPVPMPVAG